MVLIARFEDFKESYFEEDYYEKFYILPVQGYFFENGQFELTKKVSDKRVKIQNIKLLCKFIPKNIRKEV